MSAGPDYRPSHDEEERAFLQQRVALFWKVLFLISLVVDVVQAVLEHGDVLQQPAASLDRLATVAFGTLWLLCRRGSRSVRFVQTTEALGLAVVAVLISMMGRHLTPAIAPAMVAGIPGVDPRSPAVERLVDAYVSMQVMLGGSILFVLRAALIPASPWRTFGLTSILGLPYVVIPALLAPSLAGGHALRASPLPAIEVFWLSMWLAVVVMGCCVISRVIYGLRSEVREARRLGQYTLERKLGEGGMGVVYRARHGMMRRPTAIKLLAPEKSGAANRTRDPGDTWRTTRVAWRPSRLPGIQDLEARKGEVPRVSRHEAQAVHQRRCGEQTIDRRQRTPCRGNQPTPAVRDRGVDRQEPVLEPGRELLLQPETQLLPARACLQAFDAVADLSDCQHAQMQDGVWHAI